MDNLGYELESLIETVTPQIEGAMLVIKMDDWVEEENLTDKVGIEGLQFTVTLRNINSALTIQKLAVKEGVHKDPRVIDIVVRLMEFYEIYKERYHRYHTDQSQRLIEYISRREKIAEDPEKKSKTSGKRRTAAEEEVRFQSTIATNMQKMTVVAKQLADIGNPDIVIIPTHNDIPIPLVMQKSMESQFPEILEKLKSDDLEN